MTQEDLIQIVKLLARSQAVIEIQNQEIERLKKQVEDLVANQDKLTSNEGQVN